MSQKQEMSIHSTESFNESAAVNYLSLVLESQHTIKTFFNANDRTPNHDGFFELVTKNAAPQKQFIVQIKKVENLKANKIGKNKGKYVYALKTNFLAYVKRKVTENPAIYFLVDIAQKRLFWLYLSDTVLMNLNFEGKETVTYAFDDNHILSDVEHFTNVLEQIANERNRMFLNKTPEEIARLQDAIDYINDLMDHDLSAIKNVIFPGLWRFGIQSSTTDELSISFGNKVIKPEQSSLFALYPQTKGIQDTGIREYHYDNQNLFNHFNFGSLQEPMDYCKKTLHSIIKFYFENKGIALEYLPDIVLKEMLSVFIRETDNLFKGKGISKGININELEQRFCLLANYIQYILTNDVSEPCEIQIKKHIIQEYNRGKRYFVDFSKEVSASDGKKVFQQFCEGADVNCRRRFSVKNYDLMTVDYIQFYQIIAELRKRSLETVEKVWDYSYYELWKLSKEEFEKTTNALINVWLGKLPKIYEETYDHLFSTNRFKFNGKYLYRNWVVKESSRMYLMSLVHYYEGSTLEIRYDETIERGFEQYKDSSLNSIHEGLLFDNFLACDTPYYFGLACLLYEGICKDLGFKPEPLNLNKGGTRGLKLLI